MVRKSEMFLSEYLKFNQGFFCDLSAKSQETMAEKIKGSDFIFDDIDRLYYGCHKIILKRSGLYINSPNSLKNKRQLKTLR